MKPTRIGNLALLLLAGGAVGYALSSSFASRGHVVPVASWFTTVVLLILAGTLLWAGLPIRRYLAEEAERQQDLEAGRRSRRTQLDMITAYRTLVFARAASRGGSVLGGFYLGQGLFLLLREGTSLTQAVLPTVTAGLVAVALAVLGVVVERWGTLPPDDGDAVTDAAAI